MGALNHQIQFRLFDNAGGSQDEVMTNGLPESEVGKVIIGCATASDTDSGVDLMITTPPTGRSSKTLSSGFKCPSPGEKNKKMRIGTNGYADSSTDNRTPVGYIGIYDRVLGGPEIDAMFQSLKNRFSALGNDVSE